jgi:hypothetical protein
MSASRQALETIIATIPAFHQRWQAFLEYWQGEETPCYLAMGEIAHYVVDEYEKGNQDQFKGLFSTVESVLLNDDEELQNLIWVGLFENIQNIASHRTFDADVFRAWLGPQSLIAWDEVDRGMQKVAAWASRQGPRWWQFWRRHPGFDTEAALSRIQSPELRKIIEQMHRKRR